MYLRYVIDPLPQTLAERKAHNIVSRHIEARNKVVHLRRKLQVILEIGITIKTRILSLKAWVNIREGIYHNL